MSPYKAPYAEDVYDEDEEVVLPDTSASRKLLVEKLRKFSKETKQQAQERWISTHGDRSASDLLSVVEGSRCERCRDLHPKNFGPITKGVSHHLYNTLTLAASNGCELCKFLSNSVGTGRGSAELRFDDQASLVNYYFRDGNKPSAVFDVFSREGEMVFCR